MDVNLDKQIINKDVFRDPALKRKAKREAKVKLEERYCKCRELVLNLPCSLGTYLVEAGCLMVSTVDSGLSGPGSIPDPDPHPQ